MVIINIIMANMLSSRGVARMGSVVFMFCCHLVQSWGRQIKVMMMKMMITMMMLMMAVIKIKKTVKI